MMTHSMVLTNVVIKTSKIFKQRCGIWQDGAIAKEMTLTALVHRPPRVAVLGTVENRKLSIGVGGTLTFLNVCISICSALKDSQSAISLAHQWPKGYFRKGRALIGLEVSLCFRNHQFVRRHTYKACLVFFHYVRSPKLFLLLARTSVCYP